MFELRIEHFSIAYKLKTMTWHVFFTKLQPNCGISFYGPIFRAFSHFNKRKGKLLYYKAYKDHYEPI